MRAAAIESVVFRFMPEQCDARARMAQKTVWISIDPAPVTACV
jgi:hypothetical protein